MISMIALPPQAISRSTKLPRPVTMIGVGLALYLLFANPFVALVSAG